MWIAFSPVVKGLGACAVAIAASFARNAAADVTTFREGSRGFEMYASAGAGWEANVNEAAEGGPVDGAPFGRLSAGIRSQLVPGPLGLTGMLRVEQTDYAGSEAFDVSLVEVAAPLRVPVAPFVAFRLTPWAVSRARSGFARDTLDAGVGGSLQIDALAVLRARAGASYVDREARDARFSHWRRGVFARAQTRLPGRAWLGVEWIAERGTGVGLVESSSSLDEYRKGEVVEERVFVDVERALLRHLAIRGEWSRSRMSGDIRREQTEVVLALAGTF